MISNYKYFSWCLPDPARNLYALYDVLDNHFMLMSYEYSWLFHVRALFKSKTTLDIIPLSDVPGLKEHNLLDNSVIHRWGLTTVDSSFFTDNQPRSRGQTDADVYHDRIKNLRIDLSETGVIWDTFKQNLQQQLFFAHHCVSFEPTPAVLRHLEQAIGLGQDDTEVIDRFLNFVEIDDRQYRSELVMFLKKANMFYD